MVARRMAKPPTPTPTPTPIATALPEEDEDAVVVADAVAEAVEELRYGMVVTTSAVP